MACRWFAECLLRTLNFLLTLAGLGMIGYGIYLLVEWKEASVSVGVSSEQLQVGRPLLFVASLSSSSILDKLPTAWFIYLFIAIGVIVCIISCSGCIAVATRRQCCLCCYSVFIALLVLVELAFAGFIIFDHKWEEVIPTDKTGDFDMIKDFLEKHLKIVKWVALGIVILQVIQRREQDLDTLYSTVEKIVLHRWNKMTTPLHLLAYALSPRYYSSEILDIPGRVPPYRDLEVAAGYKRALNRLFSDPDVASNVRREFVDFVSGKFAELDPINDQSRLDTIGWWYLHGERYMYLQPLAIKILSQVFAMIIALAIKSVTVGPGDYDSDDEYLAPRSGMRQPLLNRQGAPVAAGSTPVPEQRATRNDAWSTRMREKYGLDTSEFTYNPTESNRYTQPPPPPPEERSRCTIM